MSNQHYPAIVTLELPAMNRRDPPQLMRLGISQDIPYPDIEGSCGRLDWRNLGTVDPNTYRNNKVELRPVYSFCLLRSDFDEETAEGNRVDHAGFIGYDEQGIRNPEPNPGGITLRGVTLGEITGTIEVADGMRRPAPYVSWHIEGNASPSVRKHIAEHCKSTMLATVERNKRLLMIHAKRRLYDCFMEQLEQLKADTIKLAETATEILRALNRNDGTPDALGMEVQP